jgi:hypothetical protein
MDTTNIGQKRPSVEQKLTAEVSPPENRVVQPTQAGSTETTADGGDQKVTIPEEAISIEKVEPQTMSQPDKPAKEKKVSIKQLQEKLRKYENLILLKDEEIDDLKEQNAYLTKKINELMEKYSVTENSEIEEVETA